MELTPRQKLLLKSCPSLSVFEEFLNNYQTNNSNNNDNGNDDNENNIWKLTFNGKTIKESTIYHKSFSGDNVVIDYGDGTVVESPAKIDHTYEEEGTYEIKLYNITNIGSCLQTISGISRISVPDNVTSFGNNCFYGCTGLTTIDAKNVVGLGDDCFSGCTNLTDIIISDDVTTVPMNCFLNCKSLTSINLPNVNTLLGSCFADCTGLTNIIISDNAPYFGTGCFSGCTNLTSINIPNSVTSINRRSFYNCPELTVEFNWDNSDDIISFNNEWSNSNKAWISIPQNTSQLYIDKGYPSDKIVERT